MEEGGEEEHGGVEEVSPADNTDHGLHVKGVASEQTAGHQAHQGARHSLGPESETVEEEMKEDGVEVVNEDVEDFVLPSGGGLNLVLYPESECCGGSVGLENIF